LLARVSARSAEIAIRGALGASRRRLIRQFLTESLFLSLLGGAVGVCIGFWMSNIPKAFPGNDFDFSPDRKVLAFTLFLSLLSGMFFGLAPALHVSKPSCLALALKSAAAGKVSVGARLRNLLVVLQVALSLVLVTGAGLLVRTMHNLRTIDLGFETEHVLVMRVELRPLGYSEKQARLIQSRLVERVANLLGVRSASLADDLPISGWFSGTRELILEDREASFQGGRVHVDLSVVTGDYFDTLGISLLRGRGFNGHDRKESPLVAIVSETAAHQFWPGQDPIGKRFRTVEFMSLSPYRQVIGIVRDTRYHRLERKTVPHLYLPLSQKSELDTMLLVRASGNPKSLFEGVRREVRALDKNLPVADLRTLADRIADRDGDQNMTAALVSMFGFLALILAMVGLYGTVSYSVSQRTREIGIRVALGAERSRLLRWAIGLGMRYALAGVAIGLVVALLGLRLISSFLYEVAPTDPVTFIVVTALLLGATLLACYIPARKAAAADPMIALRQE
jgi:predicted permease